MSESEVVRRLIKQLKRELPHAIIFKHQDLMTAGIPDVSISYGRRTTWVEVKLIRLNETRSEFSKHFDRLQLATARLLEQQAPAYYFVAHGRSAGLFGPLVLSKALELTRIDGNNFPEFAEFYDEFARTASELAARIKQR